jgi:chromosome segregation ATPase
MLAIKDQFRAEHKMVQAQKLCEQVQAESDRRIQSNIQEFTHKLSQEKKKSSALERESLNLRHQSQIFQDELSQLKSENESLQTRLSSTIDRSESSVLEFEVVRSQLRKALHELSLKDQVIQQLRSRTSPSPSSSSSSSLANKSPHHRLEMGIGMGTTRQNTHLFLRKPSSNK